MLKGKRERKLEILEKMNEVDTLMRKRIEEHRLHQPHLHMEDTGMALWILERDALKRARNYLQQAISEELGL